MIRSFATRAALGVVVLPTWAHSADLPHPPQPSTTYGITAPTDNAGNAAAVNSGTVTVTAALKWNGMPYGSADGYGIYAQTNSGNASVINSGAVTVNVSAAFSVAYGISTQTGSGNASVINSGNVSASAAAAYGILAQTNNGGNAAIFNSGTVSSNALSGWGLSVEAQSSGNATTINTGTVGGLGSFRDLGISTSAASGNATTINAGTVGGGIFSNTSNGGNATTVNYGTVSGGIYSSTYNGGNAATVNSGTVSGGIFSSASGNATVVNSGAINADKSYSGAITVQTSFGTATLVNSGAISNSSGDAIQLSGRANVLTLLPGSFITGTIELDHPQNFFQPGPIQPASNTVNIQAVNQNLTFNNSLAGATVTGTVPFVVAGNHIASVDPTGFAQADRTVMDFTRAVSGIVAGRANEAPSASAGRGGAIAFAPTDEIAARIDDAFARFPGNSYAPSDAVVFKNPTATAADGSGAWARGFYGQRVQQADGPILRSVTDFYGGAIGLDRPVRPDLRLGGFVGGGNTSLGIDQNAGSARSDIVFGGVYGRYDIGLPFLDFALLGGHMANSTTRNINNNLASTGLETATASFGGWFVSPEIAWGYRHAMGDGWSVTPSVRLRYVAADFEGFTETGSTANLTVGNRLLQNIEERGEVSVARTMMTGDDAQLRAGVHAGVLGFERVGDATVNAVLLGQSLSFATPGKNNVAGLIAGLDADWRTRYGLSFFAAADYTSMTDSSTTVTARGGVRIAF